MTPYQKANLNLIAKSISELHFEEILKVQEHFFIEAKTHQFSLHLQSGVRYEFQAKKTIWDTLKIDPTSLKRFPLLNDAKFDTKLFAAQFFLDAQKEMAITDITLAHFLEEMHNTLYSEEKIIRKIANLSISNIHTQNIDDLQFYLSGHPKILLNKGRLGFGASALKHFSPEEEQSIQFFWLLIHRDLFLKSHTTDELKIEENYFYNNVFSLAEQKNLIIFAEKNNIDLSSYSLFPVHPWQMDRFVEIQYKEEIDQQKIIPYKEAGVEYQPQISLRTFSNKANKKECDIKVSLTILNTSAYRGIAPEGVVTSHAITQYLSNIIEKDFFFKEHPTHVLKEVDAASIPHRYFSKIAAPPYRYNEMLGYIVRESHYHYLQSDEVALMAGSFFLVDIDNKSLIGECIKRSGLSPDEWIENYTKNVILPLYHLQLTHGVGLVAHGQNIVVKLKNHVPNGVFLKDFQGDLRLAKDPRFHFPPSLSTIKQLPPEYLIHDLITGHFITTWRFISPLLESENIITEKNCYQTMAKIIHQYLENHHPTILKTKDHPLNLMREKWEKVILNKVRFTIGYQDSEMRPTPLTGNELLNPLYQN